MDASSPETLAGSVPPGQTGDAGSVLTVFMGGDVYGEKGLNALRDCFPAFRRERGIDFAVINGENAANGYGILSEEAGIIFSAGIDVITGGNHTFEKHDVYPFLDSEPRMLRPANYPPSAASEIYGAYIQEDTPGRGLGYYGCSGAEIAVLNVQGREYMTGTNCPFVCAGSAAAEAAERGAVLLVDFHAESNAEKEALGLFLDGRAAAVCGTHTHVQTADGRILPRGTAYITDLGMTGARESVIGTKPETVIRRNITQVPYKLEAAAGRTAAVQGVVIRIDRGTRLALSVETVTVGGSRTA